MSNKPQGLVIDDEPDICELLGMTLEMMNIEVTSVQTVADAKRCLEDNHYHICLTDMRLPDGDGLELLDWMQNKAPAVPVAMITAHGSVETAVQALKLGAFDFLSKPIDVANLRNIVAAALRLNISGDDTTIVTQGLIGNSAVMLEVKEMIHRVARSQAPVHIHGESGTGKELVARMVHDQGPRAEAPFVPVNCGAIPAELMESELFGHKKGSFTGAVADKVGLIQSAHGGTLFLDEIGDLPLAMQVKLLRVIQEKTVRRVGDAKETSVDVRILSATHSDLTKLVSENRFREDLFYRINVIGLPVPPLRDRGDDIELLARVFLRRFSKRSGDTRYVLSDAAEEALRTYAFPGNVRELENILERAVTLSSRAEIQVDDLNLVNTQQSTTSTPVNDAANLGGQLEDVERQAIIDALEQTRYNKTAAAKLLGLSFRQLRYRIKKLEIDA